MSWVSPLAKRDFEFPTSGYIIVPEVNPRDKILPKALNAMDMRFHWLRCRNAQGKFRYYWRPGTQNLADYWTKHHPASLHTAFRPQILTSPSDPEYTKLFTKKATVTNSFAIKILLTPQFQQMAAKQHTVAARGA